MGVRGLLLKKGNNMNYYSYSFKKRSIIGSRMVMTEAEKKEVKRWKKDKKTKKPVSKKQKKRTYQNKVPRNYSLYIKSKYWTKRKNDYWQSHSKKCYRCDGSEHIQLHHMKYAVEKYGIEPDDWLIPMCQNCHFLFHDIYGSKKNMIDNMLRFENEYPYIR